MKRLFPLLVLLGIVSTFGSICARAQCHGSFLPYYAAAWHCHSHDSCAVRKPFVPTRLGGSFSLLGLSDRTATPYAGLDLEAHYWLLPRWAPSLRGSFTGARPTANASPEQYAGAAQPRIMLFSATWNNQLLLADGPRWRLTAEAGAGLAGASLYDKAQQVQTSGQHCGCTSAKRLATAVAPATELGLATTYKLKSIAGPWLTVRGGYRQWYASAPFAAPDQFSTYVLSVGLSVPDITRRP